jgi:3-isopropylmalate dehydrogenase
MIKKRQRIIAVLSGDGIGPEIMKEAIKVLEIAGKRHELQYELRFGSIGGAACDRLGVPFPEETKRICQEADAVLLGSVGGSKWDDLPYEKRPEIGGLLALRKALELYANIRPLIFYQELRDISPLSPSITNENIDLVIVRELAGGIYFGLPKSLSEDEGLDTMLYQKAEVHRIATLAFQLAASRRKRVTSVDKANVLSSSMLWRRVVSEVALEFPGIEIRHMYVDNAAMQLILNPHQFDVILTTNLFGDILSDESAAISGSLGMLPSFSLGKTTHLYEPAGGSAPDIAGKGIANPVAMILCVALMLDHTFGMQDASKEIFYSVGQIIKQGYRTKDIASVELKPVTTAAMGDAVCEYLDRLDPDSPF